MRNESVTPFDLTVKQRRPEIMYPRSAVSSRDCPGMSDRKGRAGGTMVEELQINQEIMQDLLCRLTHPQESVREGAVEALAVSVEDENWRPNELIRQGGIEIIAGLLQENNTHIVRSAIDLLIAIAAAGEEESLITGEVIAKLDAIQEHEDPLIRKKVREALWLLEPEIEDVITSKPQDE